MHFKTALICALAGSLMTACATQPDPVEDPRPVAETLPVVTPDPTPEPVAIVQAPVEAAPIISAPALPTPGSLEDFLYQSGGDARVYFGYDQTSLSSDARETLRSQAQWLNQYSDISAVIEGNADERGTREYNLALGARRANAVKSFLVSQGVAASRLTTVSYGKERPVSAGSDEFSWSLNRNGHTNLSLGGRFG